MKRDWPTRRATMEDKDAITELCLATMGPDDYVIFMLDNLIETGRTLVVEDKGKVIGTMTYWLQMDRSAWISSARTHPDYRRQRVATSILRACMRMASSDGLEALRLWTESDNESGKATFAKAGFEEVGRFTRMTASPAGSFEGRLEPLSAVDDLWRRYEKSDMMRLTKGYMNHDFGFLKLSPPLLRKLAEKGYIFRWGRNVASMDYYLFQSMKTLEAQILLDEPFEVLAELPAIAKASDLEMVTTFIPSDAGLLAAARRAGFQTIEWGREAILCEKPVEGSPLG